RVRRSRQAPASTRCIEMVVQGCEQGRRLDGRGTWGSLVAQGHPTKEVGPQPASAAWELNLLKQVGALRGRPRPSPSQAPVPVVLAQRVRQLANRLEPAFEASTGRGTGHRSPGGGL